MKNNLPSIIDEMVADLIINHEDGSITILHNRPFDDDLLSFEFNEEERTLLFKFRNKEQYLGLDVYGEYADFMYENDYIYVLQINMNTNETIQGLKVPLTIIE